MTENPRKKLVGMIPAGNDDFIELCQIDFSNPEKLLKFKPATWLGDDTSWILSASCFGIEHSWNHDFQEYVKRQTAAGNLPALRPTELFGEIGKEGYARVRGDWDEFVAYMTEIEWPLEKLGIFAEWLKAAKIHPQYAKEIIKEFLED